MAGKTPATIDPSPAIRPIRLNEERLNDEDMRDPPGVAVVEEYQRLRDISILTAARSGTRICLTFPRNPLGRRW